MLAAFLLYLDTNLNAQIDRRLQLNASVDAAKTSQLFFYRIQLLNEGDSQVSGIRVKDELPPEFKFDSLAIRQAITIQIHEYSGIWSAGAIVVLVS